jgi:transcription initiation factor TFIID subunit 1
LSKVSLREFHRPKLPLSVVRTDLAWQFQIRFIASSGLKPSAAADETKTSYQSIMMGNTHPGAISKAKLRTEADLSPTEGMLVLLEYSEERPPIFLSKGMSCKIVNYYRGDKARCPVSAGGGDRPARRKRAGEQASHDLVQSGRERPPRLEGPNRKTTIADWIGKLPKRSQKERTEKETIDILPEGVTEILHNKVHGPFLAEVDEGATVTGMVSNLFVAPMFRHEPETTDFLMILTPPAGAARPGQRDSMGVVLRDLPASCFTIGQTEPRARVPAPDSPADKAFVGPWVSYQVGKALTRSQNRDGGGLKLSELKDRVLPNLELSLSYLRQRVKMVAISDKNTDVWSTKPVGYEDYPGLEELGKSIAPEGVACFQSARAASRRLADLGITQLVTGSHTVATVGLAIVYLVGQLNAVRDLSRKTRKLVELSRSNRSIQPLQIAYYEKAASELDSLYKMLRQKHEIAQFIFEELQLTPWHLTGEFIDVHKKGEGTGMMKLTGLGDPSGQGEGFSFLREADSKPVKSIGANDALNEQVKKITGTADDLRKLTMKQMAALLRSYGMAQKQIDTLKRWDRVHVIRDLSTKAASDGIGDGLERFARGEKMKLSEQKQMYHDRIQVIWRRQLAALSMDSSDKGIGASGTDGTDTADLVDDEAAAVPGAQAKSNLKNDKDEESSDSDSDDDDDLAATLEEEMIHRVSSQA